MCPPSSLMGHRMSRYSYLRPIHRADARRSRACSSSLLGWPPAQWAWSERCAQRTLMPPRPNMNQRSFCCVATIRWRASLSWNALCAHHIRVSALTPTITRRTRALSDRRKLTQPPKRLWRAIMSKLPRSGLVLCIVLLGLSVA